MSDLFYDRLLLTFINVKNRLESLLILCHSNEYRSGTKELQASIKSLQPLMDKIQDQLNIHDNSKSLSKRSLCKYGWTCEQIQQLYEEKQILTSELLALLRLSTVAACFNNVDEMKFLKQTTGFYINKQFHSSIMAQFTKETKTRIHCDHISMQKSGSDLIQSYDTNLNILAFPQEILLHVFSFICPCDRISNIAPTCRLFAKLILSHSYIHLNVSPLISIYDIPRLFHHLPNLQSITFSDWTNEINFLTWSIWFDILKKTASNIKTIHFRNVSICPILICLCIEFFSHSLQTIIFDYQQDNNYKHFDFILCLLGDKRLKVKCVTISYQSGITNFGFLQLVNNLNILVELNLININTIDDQSIKVLCEKHNTHLKILRIDGAKSTDKTLDYIGQCRRLRKLMIEFCTNFTGSNFSLFQNFHKLEELYLSALNNISSKSFQLLFNENHSYKCMTSLKLGECHCIDDDCMQSIAQCCPNLIDFTCSSPHGITDQGFNEIVTQCNKLRYLTLNNCPNIYGEILFDVPEKYLKSIEYLNLDQCNKIEDFILIDLLERKSSLSIVNSYGSFVYLNK